MNKEQYKKRSERAADRSPILRNTLAAYLVGGAICLFGEALRQVYLLLGATEENSFVLVSVTLVALAVLATATGIFDRIARVAGGGTLVPVTGFANSVAAEALDTRAEGMVLGVGAKIFTVAGPVLLYAILAGSLYGVLLVLFGGGA